MTPQLTARVANRLSFEKSPYLLQHQFNPVDWYPWGEPAFARARTENKPIFLSIGYSTCHWCHVMERESFEDDQVAAFLREHFVSIKVDREERPDVDKIYMAFVQAMTGAGGWPLNVMLTPELKPFYGGTYFPPDDRHGRPGFLHLLQRIQAIWSERQAEVLDSASDLHERLDQHLASSAPGPQEPRAAWLARAAQVFKSDYEPRHGGFGDAPKFPRPSVPIFLLQQAMRQGDQEAVGMVLHTCERMAAGGIYDQLGGGFARYSVDAEWLVPHFEKMLYDNAQLVNLYLDAFLVSGRIEFADVARGVIRYVLRDLTHAEGGFYSAEDADSEGQEGKFYCWTRAELKQQLTPDEFRVVARYFGVTEAGNFADHSHPDPLPDLNVLSVADPALSEAERVLLESAKARMFELRSHRVRPHLDDKILTSWNGLMLGALARAGAVLGEETFLAAAERNAAFLRTHLWDEASRTLFHRWRDGERDRVQLLGAYAHLSGGILDLYEATLQPDHLEFAIALAESMISRFHDDEAGGFWQSGAEAKELIIRTKDDSEGAEPSGNSAAILALLRLAALTGRPSFGEVAKRGLALFGSKLERIPQAVPHLLLGLAFAAEEPRRVVLAGDPADPAGRRLLGAAHRVYQPRRVVLGTKGPVDSFAAGLPERGGAVAYVCTGSACQSPTSNPDELVGFLR